MPKNYAFLHIHKTCKRNMEKKITVGKCGRCGKRADKKKTAIENRFCKKHDLEKYLFEAELPKCRNFNSAIKFYLERDEFTINKRGFLMPNGKFYSLKEKYGHEDVSNSLTTSSINSMEIFLKKSNTIRMSYSKTYQRHLVAEFYSMTNSQLEVIKDAISELGESDYAVFDSHGIWSKAYFGKLTQYVGETDFDSNIQ